MQKDIVKVENAIKMADKIIDKRVSALNKARGKINGDIANNEENVKKRGY